jgi:hypothetical protein
MSSAKTIADILAFAELIDPRSFIGNPFTSQPMYIAACAFLMESAAQTSSQPTSRSTSPPPQNLTGGLAKDKRSNERFSEQKHSLLASAATQNYQRCYKSLQQLETYWAGTRYILVALDQKAKGIWDPETYTEQEYEAAKRHDMIPNWRRKLSLATAPSPGTRFSDFTRSPRPEVGSPAIDPSHAFGFSLTGTTNSPSSNLTFMYQNMNGDQVQHQPPPPGAGIMSYDPIRQTLPEASGSTSTRQARYQPFPQPHRQNSGPMPPPAPKYTPMNPDPASTSDAEMLLGLQNPPFSQTAASHHSFDANHSLTTSPNSQQDPSFDFSQQNTNVFNHYNNNYIGLGGVGDMMMESQEIDMSALGGDMIPWLEYLPQDMLQFVEGGNGAGVSSTSHINDGSNMGGMDRNGG